MYKYSWSPNLIKLIILFFKKTNKNSKTTLNKRTWSNPCFRGRFLATEKSHGNKTDTLTPLLWMKKHGRWLMESQITSNNVCHFMGAQKIDKQQGSQRKRISLHYRYCRWSLLEVNWMALGSWSLLHREKKLFCPR